MRVLITGARENGVIFKIRTTTNFLNGVIDALLEYGATSLVIKSYLNEEEE